MKEKALSPFGLPPTEQDLPVKGGECNCWPERGKEKKKRKNYKRKERKKEGRGKKLIMNNLSSELTVN